MIRKTRGQVTSARRPVVIAVTIGCCLIAVIVYLWRLLSDWNRHQDIASHIATMGGCADLGGVARPTWRWRAGYYLRKLVDFDPYERVTMVYISECRNTREVLREIEGVETIEVLRATNNSDIGDEDMRTIGGLRGLIVLDLQGTQVTDSGLRHLVGLGQLESLLLTGTQVTPEGIASLKAALPNCRISSQYGETSGGTRAY